ncbi:hypothetical protein ACFL03_12535, partial [Thermodesulfobacteriota bacterium]
KRINEALFGYDTHRIVKEILEYLIKDEHFNIKYTGDSQFLSTVEGLINIKIEDIFKGLDTNKSEHSH